MAENNICQFCAGKFDVPTHAPVEYLVVYIDIEGKVIDIYNLDADYGTLQDLADDKWRIFYQNPWQLAQRASLVQGAEVKQFQFSILTLWRMKDPAKPFEGLVAKNLPAPIEESRIIT